MLGSRAATPASRGAAFGEVCSIPPGAVLGNPSLVRRQPLGFSSFHSTSSSLPSLGSRPLTGATSLGSRPATVTPSVGSQNKVTDYLAMRRAASAPTLPPRYCEDSKHLSGQEILAQKKSRSICSKASRDSRSAGSSTAANLAVEEVFSKCRSEAEPPQLEVTFNTAEDRRESLRRELVKVVGGSAEAFRMMDLSGSGKVSLQEFTDGLNRIGVDWQNITGMRRILQVFTLFDQNCDGHIDWEEMFPPETRKKVNPRRLNTPEFWDYWCDHNDPPGGSPQVANVGADRGADRGPKWDCGTPQVRLQRLFKEKRKMKAVAHERKTMSFMFRNLKHRGKSDAQCRECLALHLPRGTGPKDRTSVQTFSEIEVRNCRKQYQDTTQSHIRQIQKEVFTMHEQRVALADTRQKLFTITGPLLAAQRLEEDKKTVAQSFKGFNLLGHTPSGQVENEDMKGHLKDLYHDEVLNSSTGTEYWSDLSP